MNEARKRPRGRPRLSDNDGAVPVQALDRGLTVLRRLARDGALTLSDLALKVGMPPSSAHRMLATLDAHGMVRFEEASQTWAVGVEAFRVGSAFARGTGLIETARPVLQALVEETAETANLAIAEGGDVVFLSQVESAFPVRAFFRPGTRGHMHASGIGKALLAALDRGAVERLLHAKGLPRFTEKTLAAPEALFEDLEQIRRSGISLDDEERYDGMRCVAAAVHDEHGTAIAGISVSGPTARFTDRAVADFSPKVRDAARDLTERLGGVVPM